MAYHKKIIKDKRIMLRKFIDNTFYQITLFTLVFGVVFYDALPLTFIDELCAVALCCLYAYYIFHTPEWTVNKLFLSTIGVFLFYLIYSLSINCNTKTAILSDFIIQLKPYLAFFTVYALAPVLNKQMKKNLQLLSLFFAVYLLMIGITYLFNSTVLDILIHHPSRLATASTIMALLYLYCSNYTMKDKIIFLLILSISLLSGRSKAYGFFVIALFVVFYLNNKFKLEFNTKNITFLSIATLFTIIVAWDKIHFYFIEGGFGESRETQDLYARMALYYFSAQLFIDYFPFGSGFATFATYTSGQHYSYIYNEYHLDMLHGLTKQDPKFIADTYYPALAQFGVVGAFLFFLFWVILLKKAFSKFYAQHNLQLFAISILIIFFFIIECTSDATITHNRGLFIMMLLALSLKDKTITPSTQK